MKLEGIERLTKEFADARDRLANTVGGLEARMETLKRQCLPAIKVQVRKAKERQAELREALEEGPDLFRRPRTVIMHGIRVGYEKGKGKISFEDTETVVRLIKKHFPEQFEILVEVKEKPRKKALGDHLQVAELKKIGCTVGGTGDVVVIRPVDSEVDKIVEALLKDEEKIAEDQVA
jgi:hypothetical protein